MAALRPHLSIRPYTWKAGFAELPGIALVYGHGTIRAHLTLTEARTMADTLHDLSDRIDERLKAESQALATPTESDTAA